MNKAAAISKINKYGMLLVFPKNNAKEPHSLWAEFNPRTKLKWEWDDDGDQKVFEMWALMKDLSDCRDVVYSKWYQGRATFFSRSVFSAMLAAFKQTHNIKIGLSESAKTLLDQLEMDSPLSTRDLKKLTDLQGKFHEPTYNRALKDLFMRLLIVAFGEVDDGAFPSLAVGATTQIYEDLWLEADSLNSADAQSIIEKWLPEESSFRKFFEKVKKDLTIK
jgi:hypothetical protein